MSEGENEPPPIEPGAAAELGPELAPNTEPAPTTEPTVASGPAPAPVTAPPPERGPLPGAWATLGGGLDLSLSANRELRRASLYIGLLTLAMAGPFALIVVAFGASQGGFDWIQAIVLGYAPDLVPVDPSVGTYLLISGCIALVGLLAVGIESQIMAAAILGGRAFGRPVTMREALRRSRQVFWRVVRATFLVGLILIVPNAILTFVLASVFDAYSEAPTVIATGIGALLSAPFAYIITGIVLGDVAASEAVRRSTLLARARWRLALAVTAVGAIAGYIELFATGAGVDVLARVGGMLHLGFDSSGGTIALNIVVLAGVLAIGSLTFTLAALRDAPQVVAFIGMTGYGAGLDLSRERPAGEVAAPVEALANPWDRGRELPVRRQERWISIPMVIAIIIGVLAGIGGVLALS